MQFVWAGSSADAHGRRVGDLFPGTGEEGEALTAEAIAAAILAGEPLRGRRRVGAKVVVAVEFGEVRGAVSQGDVPATE